MAPELAAKMAILGQRLGIVMMVVVTITSTAAGVELTNALIRGGLGLTTFSALGWVCALAMAAVPPPARAKAAEEPHENRVDVTIEDEEPDGPISWARSREPGAGQASAGMS